MRFSWRMVRVYSRPPSRRSFSYPRPNIGRAFSTNPATMAMTSGTSTTTSMSWCGLPVRREFIMPKAIASAPKACCSPGILGRCWGVADGDGARVGKLSQLRVESQYRVAAA